MEKHYCIKSGYRINPVVLTMDYKSNKIYWDKIRIRAAKYYQYHVYKFASDFIKRQGLKNLVDVGCGPGVKLGMIHRQNPGLSIIGVDQERAIQYCQKNYNYGQWIVDDFENPSELDKIQKADIVICSDVIEHVYDPDKLLTYISNALSPGGYIVLSTPERDFVRGVDCVSCEKGEHVREWNMAEFKSYVEMMGFTVLKQFCVRPYRLNLGKEFLFAEIFRVFRGAPAKNNQVLLIKKT